MSHFWLQWVSKSKCNISFSSAYARSKTAAFSAMCTTYSLSAITYSHATSTKQCTSHHRAHNIRHLLTFADLHHSDSSIGDCSPVHRSNEDPTSHKRTDFVNDPISQINDIHNGTCRKQTSVLHLSHWVWYMPLADIPSLGYSMRYSVLHWGQETLVVLLPRCFSSIQRWRHTWCTHLLVPLHLHGLTHAASRSSSSVAKHTQQDLERAHTSICIHLMSHLKPCPTKCLSNKLQ